MRLLPQWWQTRSHGMCLWSHSETVILNPKKGKTEAIIFGTAKRLAMLNKSLKVKYKHHTDNVTTSYRYLEVVSIPPQRSATILWQRIRKLLVYTCWTSCGSSWIRKQPLQLISHWSFHFSPIAAFYLSSITSRELTVSSLDPRATRIVNRHVDQAYAVSLPSIASIKKKRDCLFVRKDLLISQVLSSIMSYLYWFDN